MTHAYLNHGRWVAECVCGGAERLWPGGQIQTDPETGAQYGLTNDGRMICGNKEFCGIETEVAFPTDDECAAIVQLLAVRPVPSTRNWLPGEPVADLAAENVEHGVTAALGD